MKVLAIAPQPFFSPRGTPLSVYYRTLVTAEMGHQVDLLTYGQGVDADIPGVRIVRIPAFRRLGQVKVGPSLLKAFLDFWIFWYAVAMMARNRYDVVHAHEEAVFFARFLRPIFRYKLIYDLHSILSQQLTNFEFTRSRFLIGLFARLEDGCLKNADGVISISPALAKYAVARVRDPEAHFLIENSLFDPLRLKNGAAGDSDSGAAAGDGGAAAGDGGAVAGDGGAAANNSGAAAGDGGAIGRDGDRGAGVGNGDDGGSRARPADSWLALLDGARPVILYAGTFESYQGIDMLLEAFALLLQGTPPVSGPGDPPDAAAGATEDAALSPASAAGKHGAGPPPAAGKTRPFLLLLGGRPQQVEEARARAGELGIGNDCHFAGTVSRELAQRATRAADVLTSPRTVGDNTPLKIYEQIASRVPLVATRIGSHTQVLSDDECVLVDPDPQSMADGLATALRGGADVARRVANAHALYETSYSPEAYRDKMQRLFARLEGGPR